MDMVETTSTFGKMVWRDVGEFAAKANRQMRHSNVYRAAEYQLAAQHGIGAKSLINNQYAIDGLGNFVDNDQDTFRPDWARKLQLAGVSKRLCFGLANMVERCAEHPTNNPVVLRQLRQISDAVVGPRASAADARAYMKRAALKLHPDKCADLEGWRIPNIGYSKYMPADHKYEQAKWGAEGLFALHRSLDKLYANEHYALALYEPAAKNGASLKPKSALAEYSLVSAVFCCVVPEAITVAGAGGALLAVWWFFTLAKQQLAKRKEVTCRELVSFAPKQPTAQAIGEQQDV